MSTQPCQKGPKRDPVFLKRIDGTHRGPKTGYRHIQRLAFLALRYAGGAWGGKIWREKERDNEEGWDSDDDGGFLIGGPSPRLVVGNS
jgi:hypothetical protein